MEFSKYHGAGNDFVIIDDRSVSFDHTNQGLIAHLCDRHFGIGADGLMLLRNHPEYDFEMVYFNADGKPSSMCGNGGRCLVAFAYRLGVIQSKTTFMAVDGIHHAEVLSNDQVKLAMNDVETIIEPDADGLLIDTGSPHYLIRKPSIDQLDVFSEGRAIRNSDPFRKEGVNVNFLERKGNEVFIRTYERGVEDETLACGTGVTAAALAMAHWESMSSPIQVKAVGGVLSVDFERTANGFKNIWKTGPVQHVFDGQYRA
jgi:diaminopimelate epimerase